MVCCAVSLCAAFCIAALYDVLYVGALCYSVSCCARLCRVSVRVAVLCCVALRVILCMLCIFARCGALRCVMF